MVGFNKRIYARGKHRSRYISEYNRIHAIELRIARALARSSIGQAIARSPMLRNIRNARRVSLSIRSRRFARSKSSNVRAPRNRR